MSFDSWWFEKTRPTGDVWAESKQTQRQAPDENSLGNVEVLVTAAPVLELNGGRLAARPP